MLVTGSGTLLLAIIPTLPRWRCGSMAGYVADTPRALSIRLNRELPAW